MNDDVVSKMLGMQEQILKLALNNQDKVNNLENRFDEFQKELAEVKATMATKDELAEVKANMVTKDELAEVKEDMVTKSEFNQLKTDVKAIKKKVDKIEEDVTWNIQAIIDYTDKLDKRITKLELARA